MTDHTTTDELATALAPVGWDPAAAAYCGTCGQIGRHAESCPDRPAAEPLYLVCRQCGEAFDSMTTAATHTPGACGSDQGWDLLPESEAM